MKIDYHHPVGEDVKTTTCYMCACRCGIVTHLRDNRIAYIEGNKKHPVNKGVICAKGAAGIQQHRSPARLASPLLRTGPRGSGEFKTISWEEALAICTQRLANIRRTDPNRLAFFTGRDQSQAFTGWWAQQFGTMNYAAHGGFCSVNMAAAGMYTTGGSFWEFGEPDWRRTRYLMLWGVAEDHDSNPLKLGLGELKARGVKITAINPIRTGYAAIADEWVGIRPGTDGLLIAALIHEILKLQAIDSDYLLRYTNAHWLVVDAPGTEQDGLFLKNESEQPLCWARATADAQFQILPANRTYYEIALSGDYVIGDRSAVTSFELIKRRFLGQEYAPETVAERCGIAAITIRRLAKELAHAAFELSEEVAIAWKDKQGNNHASMKSRPVSMHAMRGISAHSNGFQTCRMLHVLQILLGSIDAPGGHRYQPPYPKGIPPSNKPGKSRKANGSLDAYPLGYPVHPKDLVIDAQSKPLRIDKAFSWEYPLAVHGMLHTVIRNAWAADPYPIDTLFLFMANMSWNSAMNTRETQQWLTDIDPATGEYRIPYIIYSDAYHSEMVQFADLVLPDTTYLERFDVFSFLDRPISDADAAIDGIRQPVVEPDRNVKPFQDVLLALGAQLGLPGMVNENGQALYPNGYQQYICEHQRAPGVGLLAGWRADGTQHGKGSPNPDQLRQYMQNDCFFSAEIPESAKYFKMANQGYFDWAAQLGFIPDAAAPGFTLALYCEPLQHFRLAAQGFGDALPPEKDRARIARYFDPIPFWYPAPGAENENMPLTALTQRPMFMYHAWGSQNKWLRQIAARNWLYIHPHTARRLALVEGEEVWLESAIGKIKVPIKLNASMEPNTVWTWNAIGKRKGAWGLSERAPEHRKGFLLNHLINDVSASGDYANADPITGQGAWFDLRVHLRKIEDKGLV